MKKQINVDHLANELRGASLFFKRPAAQPTAPASARAQTPGRPDTQTSRRQDVQNPRRPRAQGPGRFAAAAPTFDLGEKAEERQTLRLTEAEWKRLDALTGQLADELGVRKVEKNDIIRCGLHALLEEYEQQGRQSQLLIRLRKKYR